MAFTTSGLHADKTRATLEYAPRLVTMGAEHEHESMTMDCDGEAPFDELDCAFHQARVTPVAKPNIEAEVAKEVAASRASGPRGIEATCKELRKLSAKPLPARKGSQPEGRRNLAIEELKRYEEYCSCADDGCRGRVLREMVEAQYDGVCKLWQGGFEQLFRRTGPRTWTATTMGSCGVVTVLVLEHEQDHPSLWTLTQTRTGKPSASKDPVCEALILNVPFVWSYRFNHARSIAACRIVEI